MPLRYVDGRFGPVAINLFLAPEIKAVEPIPYIIKTVLDASFGYIYVHIFGSHLRYVINN